MIQGFKKEDLNLEQVIDEIELYIKKCEQFCVILLDGNLGSGKSYLVSSFAKRYDICSSSPTFSFVNEYVNTAFKIYHYDFYMKDKEEAFINLLNFIYLDEKFSIHFVEWGEGQIKDRLLGLKIPCLYIKISLDKDLRVYSLSEG